MAWQAGWLLLLIANLISTKVDGLSITKREARLFDKDLFVFSAGPFSDRSKSFQGFLPIYPNYGHASENSGRHQSQSSSFSLEEGPLPSVSHPTRGAQLSSSGLPLEFSQESARAAKQPSSGSLANKPFTVFAQQPRRGKALSQFSGATSAAQFAGQVAQPQRQVFGFSGSQMVQQSVPQFGGIQGFDGFAQFEPFDQIQAAQPQQSLEQFQPQPNVPAQPQPQQFFRQPQQFQSQTVFQPQEGQAVQQPAQPQPTFQAEQPFRPQQQQFQPQPQRPQFQPEQFTGVAQTQRGNDRQGARLHLPSSPQASQFQPQGAVQLEPQANLDPRGQRETLFSSINKPATDREPRKQLSDLSKMKHMSRNDALARLMDIAGSDWDLSVSIEQNLVGGAGEGTSDFDCPTPEGHFPDQERCHVYYQCSNGIANKQKCPAGLKYNVLTNQCDWEASVDCSLNKDPRMLRQHAGPSPRPRQQVAESFTSQAFASEQQQNFQQLPFSTFFRI